MGHVGWVKTAERCLSAVLTQPTPILLTLQSGRDNPTHKIFLRREEEDERRQGDDERGRH